MAKVKLGKRPVNFDRTLKFKGVNGDALSIGVTYKYRTRKEYAAWLNELVDKVKEAGRAKVKEIQDAAEAFRKAAAARAAAGEPEPPTDPFDDFGDAVGDAELQKLEAQVDFIMGSVDKWDLDEEFTRENVEQFCSEQPAGGNAIQENYRAAINEGRTGN